MTAYVHREMPMLLRPTPVWEATDPPSVGDDLLAGAEDMIGVIAPLTADESYQNFPNRLLPNPLQQYFGENLERLIDVKTTYDPGNLFQHEQSIPEHADACTLASSSRLDASPSVLTFATCVNRRQVRRSPFARHWLHCGQRSWHPSWMPRMPASLAAATAAIIAGCAEASGVGETDQQPRGSRRSRRRRRVLHLVRSSQCQPCSPSATGQGGRSTAPPGPRRSRRRPHRTSSRMSLHMAGSLRSPAIDQPSSTCDLAFRDDHRFASGRPESAPCGSVAVGAWYGRSSAWRLADVSGVRRQRCDVDDAPTGRCVVARSRLTAAKVVTMSAKVAG